MTEKVNDRFPAPFFMPPPVQPKPEVIVPNNSAENPPMEIDSQEASLGELNPLIHAPDLNNVEVTRALVNVTRNKIDQYGGGVIPEVLGSRLVTNLKGDSKPRFIARFIVDELSEEQIVKLEKLVKRVYRGMDVNTRTDPQGNDLDAPSFPPSQPGEYAKASTRGWYMGPDLSPLDSLHTGLFVFKNLGEISRKNFTNKDPSESKYIVEVREAGMFQTDLVEFITQVSSILGRNRTEDYGKLLYEIYYDLIRLGLKRFETGSLYGMDDAIARIKRGLLIPLANRDLSGGVNQSPESVLLAGVPGTGKTLIVEQLLREETDLFILPLDPLELSKELSKDKKDQRVLPRISDVSKITGRGVVLHVDDIENMVQGEMPTHSTLLNLMAGIRDSNFYMIASTNNPEKIDKALIQPQRFGILIHCGLQPEEARLEILRIHAEMISRRLGIPLFYSEEARDIMLSEVAHHTRSFTPRFLAEIVNVAKSYLVEQVSRQRGRVTQLTEEDLRGHVFSVEDWEKAVAEVSSIYNATEMEERDNEIKKFVDINSKRNIGYVVDHANRQLFSKETRDRLAAIKMQNGTE